MAVFSYLYCFTLFQETRIDVGGVLDMALSLDEPNQLELFGKLGTYLVGEGVLPGMVLSTSTYRNVSLRNTYCVHCQFTASVSGWLQHHRQVCSSTYLLFDYC